MSDRPEKPFVGPDATGVPPTAEEPAAERTRLVGQEATAGLPRIYVARQVLEFVEACARRAAQDATAGLLMGRALKNAEGQRFVLIDGGVEAPEVEAAARSVKFTPRAWKSLRAVAAEAFAHREIIGWFHARPGEPMYLSPYETFVQQTHFGAPWQVALVYDPSSGERAWWGWNGEALERVPGFRVWEAPASRLLTGSDVKQLGYFEPADAAPSPSPRGGSVGTWERGMWPASRAAAIASERRRRMTQERTSRSPWRRVARVLQGVTVLVLVFVGAMLARWGIERLWPQLLGAPGDPVGYVALEQAPGPGGPSGAPAFVGAGSSDVIGGGPATPALPQLPPRAGETTAGPASGSVPTQSPAPASAPGQVGSVGAGIDTGLQRYRVQPGETLWLIAQRFYGDPTAYRWLAEVNGIRDPRRLVPGQELILPPRDGSPPRRK